MKCLARRSIVSLLLITSGAACANELSDADIEIVSVSPRSSDVKPIGMSVSPDGRHEPAKLVSRDSASDSGPAKLASAESPKSVPSPGGALTPATGDPPR
jgi:hypothetical protein